MTALIPYLDLHGECEAALELYASALGGRVTKVIRYGEMQIPCPAGHDRAILHAELEVGGLKLMANDGRPGEPRAPSNGISLALALGSNEEQDRVFARLAEGGTVIEPIHEAFFGRFGMLVDRFGISWMLTCERPA